MLSFETVISTLEAALGVLRALEATVQGVIAGLRAVEQQVGLLNTSAAATATATAPAALAIAG